jgi:glucokinase
VISVVGPGTGLGVAQLWRHGGIYRVQPTEGGHIDFAPLDGIEDAILARLRKRHRRVSAERVVAGPGIVDIYETLAAIEGKPLPRAPTRSCGRWAWRRGQPGGGSGRSLLPVAGQRGGRSGAGARFGGAGDGWRTGLRIKDVLLTSGFAERFRAKGRFEGIMAAMPVRLITHPQPGLFGAAAAFAQAHPLNGLAKRAPLA